MKLLIDTQVLAWLLSGDRRLRKAWIDALADPAVDAAISAVTAWEYSDLRQRGRLPVRQDIAEVQALYSLTLVPLPAECWLLAADMPATHRDPVDRMLVAHARAQAFTLITADEAIRNYPVDCLW